MGIGSSSMPLFHALVLVLTALSGLQAAEFRAALVKVSLAGAVTALQDVTHIRIALPWNAFWPDEPGAAAEP